MKLALSKRTMPVSPTISQDYELVGVVFGGAGVNLNTAESDEGAKWIEAKDITAFDASLEPAELGALDTVVFFFDPEAVNQYTGENGLTAQIIGKYVAPVEPDFYIAGTMTNWELLPVEGKNHVLNLEAGEHKLKVVVGGEWKGFDALTTVADGLSKDADGNICFELKEAGEVNVHYDAEYFFLNGNFYVAPVEKHFFLKNNWNGAEEWTWKELVYDEDNKDYELVGVVFGGTGVNLNTAEEMVGTPSS